jgi:hypothetical protein
MPLRTMNRPASRLATRGSASGVALTNPNLHLLIEIDKRHSFLDIHAD